MNRKIFRESAKEMKVGLAENSLLVLREAAQNESLPSIVPRKSDEKTCFVIHIV